MTTKQINALQRMEVLVASFDTNMSGYPVMVELGDGRIFKSVLRLDGLRDPPGNGDKSAVRAYGLELFQRLFDDTLADAFYQAWGAAQDGQQKLRLRLWLDGGDRILHAIPWELLHYDVSGGAEVPLPIATDSRVIFSRYLSSNEPWGEPITRRPIRVLVIVSDPIDLGPGNAWPHLIPVGKEEYRRDLESRFYPLYSTGQIDYRFLEPASAEQWHNALQDGYDVVMYFGHGVYHPSGGGWLLLEDDETGEGRLYEGMTLARRLKQAGHRPALVILVGCETARQFSRSEKANNRKNAPPQTSASRVELTATSSLASLLVQHGGVPAVLAMQRLVDITLARTFSYFLSDQLLQHGVIDVAVNAARLRVYEQEHIDWSTPVLYMRSQDGQLFAPNPRLEYALSILTNYEFARWRGPEFIYLEALTVPPGEDWTMLRRHPEDAPSSQDALAAMRRTLAPDMRFAGMPDNGTLRAGIKADLSALRWGAQTLAQHTDRATESTEEPATTVTPRNLVALVGAQHSGMSVLLRRMALDLADEACHGPLNERTVCPLPHMVQNPKEAQTETQEKKPEKAPESSAETTMHIPVSGMGLSELSGAERFAQRTIGIYIPLKGYEDYKGGMHRLEQLIIAVASQTEPSLGDALDTLFREAREQARTFADEPTYVFLLDSLDAVAEELRGEAARDIVDLSLLLPDQHIILSCNQNVFPTPMFRSATVLFVMPINERMVLRYLRQRNPRQSMELFRQIIENGLLGLTTDPDVLSLIYWRLTQRGGASLTRAQLVDDFVSRALEKIPLRYAQGDAAYQTMIELAWLSRWHHQDVLQLSSVFDIMAHVRQKRDYNLENLFQILLRAGFLLNVGMREVRFSHSLLASYCAALSLRDRADWLDRLQDITVMCSVPYRQIWWEDTIYVLVGLLHNTERLVDLFRVFVNVSYAWTGSHTLLVARCLAAMPDEQRRSLPVGLQFELLDCCVQRLWPSYEDAPERRAKTITSLASLNYPHLEGTTGGIGESPEEQATQTLIDDTLIALLVDRVRLSTSGAYYDYTEVRIAAARALLTRYSVMLDRGKDVQLYRHRQGETSGYLNWLLHSWKNHEREKLREVLLDDSSSAPERAIAAFALGDLGYDEDAEDARFLLEVIVRPDDGSLPEGWGDTIWAAADALILLDANLVSEQLAEVLAYEEDLVLWEGSTRQLIYIAGRVRTQEKHVIEWLLRQFLHHPSHTIKARALRSFGWLSETLRSFGWLSEALESLGLERKTEQSPQSLVKQVIESIALWDVEFLLSRGLIQTANTDQGKATRYLRKKAVESLAWIGDQETLFRIQAVVYGWDLELREAWYATSNAIEGRLGQYE